jgi:hypothetical protein
MRAIDSVFRQTLTDWELVITDDEQPPGQTWRLISDLAARDDRIRVTQNPGPHGQSGNVNNGLRKATAPWIKPLYDDDVLREDCLRVLLEAAGGDPSTAIVTCSRARYRDGRLIKTGPSRRGPRVTRLPRDTVHLALYLQDVEIGTPTQTLVNRSIVQRGVLFEDHPNLPSGVDTWWFTRLLRYGDLLMINEVLAEEHQGTHSTITSTIDARVLDREMELLRELTLPMVDPSHRPPPLHVAKQSLRLMRAVHRLMHRRPAEALPLVLGAWHPAAWWLAVRCMLRRRFPGRFEIVPRHVVEP